MPDDGAGSTGAGRAGRAVTLRATGKLAGYLSIALACLVAALAMRRAEMVAVATPMLVAIGVALTGRRPGGVEVTVSVGALRTVETVPVRLTVGLLAGDSVPLVELRCRAGVGLDVAGAVPADAASSPARSVTLDGGRRREVELALVPTRFGVWPIDAVDVRAHDALFLLTAERSVPVGAVVRVYPRPEALAAPVVPQHTQLRAGNRLSRSRGAGIEFTEVRQYLPGDEVRHVDWAVTSRRGELHIDTFSPERNGDAVLLLDTFDDLGEPRASTLQVQVRAVAALAERLLADRDRVGVIGFGGVLRWLLPGMGGMHRQRILDALLDTSTSLHYAWRDITVLPPRLLPPRAMVVVVSPLVDERILAATVDLHARRHDVVIIAVSPLPFVRPARNEVEVVARRIWSLQRSMLLEGLRGRGIAVGEWTPERSLHEVVEEVRRFRRRALRRPG